MFTIEISEELESLVPKFLKNREDEALKIIDLIEKNDYDEIKAIGHKIKGVSGGYGFDKLTEIGGEIEDLAPKKEGERIKKLAEDVLYYLKNVKISYVEEEF